MKRVVNVLGKLVTMERGPAKKRVKRVTRAAKRQAADPERYFLVMKVEKCIRETRLAKKALVLAVRREREAREALRGLAAVRASSDQGATSTDPAENDNRRS